MFVFSLFKSHSIEALIVSAFNSIEALIVSAFIIVFYYFINNLFENGRHLYGNFMFIRRIRKKESNITTVS